jgi:hypothetical protein
MQVKCIRNYIKHQATVSKREPISKSPIFGEFLNTFGIFC